MIVHTDVIQGSEPWFQLRSGKCTASRFSDFVSTSGDLKKPQTLKDQAAGKLASVVEGYIQELVAETWCPEFIAFAGNFATDRGMELEPEARDVFQIRTGLEVRQVGFVTRNDKIAGCSPDGLIVGKGGEYVAGLELKCPFPKKHVANIMTGGLPEEYKAQVHGGMAVTGLDRWWFMSYYPGLAPLILKVERDAYTDRLSRTLDEFIVHYAAYRQAANLLLKP